MKQQESTEPFESGRKRFEHKDTSREERNIYIYIKKRTHTISLLKTKLCAMSSDITFSIQGIFFFCASRK